MSVVLRDAEGHPEGVSLTVRCARCGTAFEFAGIQSSACVLVSEDRTELRPVIAEPAERRKDAGAEAPASSPR